MQFIDTTVVDAKLIEPSPRLDDRGRFMRVWCKQEFEEHGLAFAPVQANMGFSLIRGTLRGMHYQEAPALEAKLVRCTRGSMFDVALDLRRGSPSYRKWFGEILSAENGRMLYIPEGCAHGYQTLEDGTEMHYMASGYYTPSAAKGVRFDDPAFSIEWPLPATALSEQDQNWPLMRQERNFE